MKVQEQYTYPEVTGLLLNSIEKITNYIAYSYGPNGGKTIMHTLIADEKNPLITNDGFTILNNLHFQNPFDSLARRLLWNASFQTNLAVGDGTTTSVLLAGELIAGILRNQEFTKNPRQTEKQLNEAETLILKELKKKVKKVKNNKQIKNLAFISSRNEKIAGIIKDLYDQLGVDSHKTLVAGLGSETEVENITDGLVLNCDVLDSVFYNDLSTLTTKLEGNIGVVVTTKKLLNTIEVVRIAEAGKALKKEAIILLCNDIESVPLNACKQSIQNPEFGIKIYPLRAPSLGERQKAILGDVAFLVGADLIDNHQGKTLTALHFTQIGSCKEVYFDARKTIIKGGSRNEQKVKEMLEQVDNLIKNSDETGNDINFLLDRRKNLLGKISLIKVGSETFVETMDLKTRFEDALRNAESATKEGILEGAGVPLFEIAKNNFTAEKSFDKLMFSFLSKPINTLRETVGLKPFGQSCSWSSYKFDYLANKEYDNLIDAGIIDSYASVASSLKMAFSLARSICGIRVVLIEDVVALNNQDYSSILAKKALENK